MEAQIYLQKTLRERLDQLKNKNSSFSLRAFARLLEVSPASLSEFLNGKRVLSPKMVMKLADKLCLDPEEFSVLNDKLNRDKKGVSHEHRSDRKIIQLQNDQYYLISDWIYYGIKNLAKTKDFQSDSKWIAKRLKSTHKKVSDALERLLRLGILKYNNEGKLVHCEIDLKTSDDIPNTSIKKRHAENLEAAKESLYVDDVMVRDFSCATLAIDPKRLPQAKKMIREFQDQLFDFLEGDEPTEVYEVCMQLFPRTNIKKEQVYEKYQ